MEGVEPGVVKRRGRPTRSQVRRVPPPEEEEEEGSVDDEEYVDEDPAPKRGRRRRPKSKGKGQGRPPKSPKGKTKVTCLSIPVTEQDDEEVECKLCKSKMTFRAFRIHNMQTHANIATTTDDPTIPEHKFYERKLKELAKFTKVKIFKCPVNGCTSSYKSSLGLAYHLETCGKTKEERALCLLECDICGKKFTLPNLTWHKKSHHRPEGAKEKNVPRNELMRLKTNRKSAIKARETIARENDDEPEQTGQPKSKKKKQKEKDKDFTAHPDPVDIEFIQDDKTPTTNKPSGNKSDFTTSAIAFISSNHNANAAAFWSHPRRVLNDAIVPIEENPWIELQRDTLMDYLPRNDSLNFKTIFHSPENPHVEASIKKEFRQLPAFVGEVVDNEEGNLVYNTGGPILGLSWHPSGNLLAVSTGKDMYEDVDYKIQRQRKSNIQIYSHYYKKDFEKDVPINVLTPQLILCADFGYATHLQWSNFRPSCWDKYDKECATFNLENKQTRIGHLACSFEDGTIRIYALRIADLGMAGSFRSESMIPVYKKEPEVCLELDPSTFTSIGQITKFEWHEENRLLVAGYCSGLVALFDLQTKSPLLQETSQESNFTVTTISPFWAFQAHLSPVTGVNFDPMSSRYLLTASKDRYLKLWDLHLRQEIESRKIGLVTDTCWIRGWIHIAISVDSSISNYSSHHNYVRFYQIGTSQARPNCAEYLDISSLSFHEGITLQATENGVITASYFDNFWREIDFERNKKKHNVVNISRINLDSSSYEPLTSKDLTEIDLNLKSSQLEQKPRVILTFFKERVKSGLHDGNPQFFEDYIRFLPLTRVNKVCWCPIGECFATGYRNGLLTIIPASFESLYG